MREARPADAAALAALHAQAFGKPWSAETFEVFLGDANVGAALTGDGFILWRAVAGEAEILTLAVAPQARRQGLAKALLARALDLAEQAGATEMFLEVSDRNIAAVALYSGAGFAVTGLRKAYYETENQPQDALTMRLSLTAGRGATITGPDHRPLRS